MDQRYNWAAYCQQRYGGDGSYMDGPQYAQHMPRSAYKQSYNNFSRPSHNYSYSKHNPADVDNYYKQPQPPAPSHWQQAPAPPAQTPLAPPTFAPPNFAPPAPSPASLASKSNNTDVVTLILENNNLKRMIVHHMSLLQELTDKVDKKDKRLDEKKSRIETLLSQNQELLNQISRLGHTIEELRNHKRRSNKRTAIEDVAPKPKVPCFVENQTQTEAVQQVFVEQLQQVVEPLHQCYQPAQPSPQRKLTPNVIVTSVTELPPTTPAIEHIKGRGGFNGGKKISTIILHRVHQESSSLQLQEEQEKQEHEEREHDDETDQLQIDEDMQSNMHEQDEQHEQAFLEGEQVQLHDDEQHIFHDGMEGMTETVIGAEEELGAVEELTDGNINNGHMIQISDMGHVVGHIDIERLRRMGINCVKHSEREHQQQLHLYEAPQPQLIQSSAEDEVVNALLQSQQSEIVMSAEPIEMANITDSPQKLKASKYQAPILNVEPTKKVRTFAKTRVNQVVRKLPTLENSRRIENVPNYIPLLAKTAVWEQKRQEAEEQERQLQIQLKQAQDEQEEQLQQQKRLEQIKLEQQRELEQQQEQERQQQLIEEELKRQQREKQEQEERAKQKEQERQQQLVQEQLKKQEQERQQQMVQEQLKIQEQERQQQLVQEQLKKQEEERRDLLREQEQKRLEQLKKQEQARQEELMKVEQQKQMKRQEEMKKKLEQHLMMFQLERAEKKTRLKEKKRKLRMEQKKQEREKKKKIEVQKIKERNKERQELLRERIEKQDGNLISEVQTEVVKSTPQPDSEVEHQNQPEQQQSHQKQQSELIEEEEEDVEETIVRRLQEHLQKEQQRMQEHIQKEQQRLQGQQQQQPMVRLKRSPMDRSMVSNTSLIYPPLPQSSTTTTAATTITPSSTMTPAPTPPPTNEVSPRLRGVKKDTSTTTTTIASVITATTNTTVPTPLTPQSTSKRKRQHATNKSTSRFLSSMKPYTTRSWEDQEFHCDNEFFLEEADELLADNPSLEIPIWNLVVVPKCADSMNVERLGELVYELRHDRYIKDEIERKKRDARYNLEQNKIEALRQRHNQDEVLVPLPPLPTSTFYPLPDDIEGIEFVSEVPVQAFGENMLNPHTQQQGHFTLPWLAATMAPTAEERAKAAAKPVATLASKKLPTTKKEASQQERHSSYVFLKRRKRQQRR